MNSLTAISRPMKQIAIHTATRANTARFESAMTLAFSADPAARWAWSDPDQFLRTFMPLVTLFGGKSFDHGTAYVAEDFRGVAQFLPPGVQVDDGPIGELFERNMTEPGLGKVLGLFEQMASFHPREPHWYIPLIGVDPAFQGQGYGSALMNQGLAVCDRDGQLAYLEATSPVNRLFYERHGFRTLGEIRVGDSPPMFPMLREPR
ncbi:GNAT family N-acetyltransferase [Frigidibacter sp. RF13]|uniref:GNAT family N-acetyltransferase n=1 Tax=Frigidibacter sp. RF13 TaxID=2997340 RepID=UPI00227190BE|nr:GNAT family N-acetyltransferase [Frigidibacter sp. RF13]MCY1125739.1 GNAT family N-acetyltransferase [Frigidibacter sp. RF13]